MAENQNTNKDNPDSKKKTSMSDSTRQVAWGVYWMLIVGFVAELIYAFSGLFIENSFSFFDGLGSTLLVSGACLGVGALTGFLFAIPREVDGKPDANPTNGNPPVKKSRISNNDNLVQVSDWLTKIIVGVGLTQIYSILPKLKRIGEFMSISFGQGEVGRNAAIATILYFSVVGFLGGYLWTRLFYVKLMARTNNDVGEIEAELDETKQMLEEKETELGFAKINLEGKKKEVEEQKTTLEVLKGDLEAKAKDLYEKELEIIKRNEILNELTKGFVNNEIDNNSLLIKEPEMDKQILGKNETDSPLEKLYNLAKERWAKKKDNILVHDDLQKNLWGGSPENNGYKLVASVEDSQQHKGLFDVVLSVVKSTGDEIGLPVAFYIHDSFGIEDNVIYAEPDDHGKVSINLVSYEAFTAGALLPDGTELELDLNDTSLGFPGLFYWT